MNSTTKIDLPPPAPDQPAVARMVSEGLDRTGKSLVWAVGQPHPIASDGTRILRMFIVSDPDAVEVYSVSQDGQNGMRDRIPWSRILIVGEAMTLDVFVDELTVAEGGDDEPDEPDPSEPAVTAPPPNGQTTVS